jgi:hypothetical protein
MRETRRYAAAEKDKTKLAIGLISMISSTGSF